MAAPGAEETPSVFPSSGEGGSATLVAPLSKRRSAYTREEMAAIEDAVPSWWMFIAGIGLMILIIWMFIGCITAAIVSGADTVGPHDSTVTCNISIAVGGPNCNVSVACCTEVEYNLTWRHLLHRDSGCFADADLNRTEISCHRRGGRLSLTRIPTPPERLRRIRITAWTTVLVPAALFAIACVATVIIVSCQSWGRRPWMICCAYVE